MPIVLILILITGVYFILTALPKTQPRPEPTAEPQAATPPAERAPTGRLVTIADLRVPGETGALVVGGALLVVVLMLLLRITFGTIFVLMALALVWIRVRQGQMVGQAVKVTEHQLPDVYAVACQAADRLCMPLPDVFVTQHPIINAYALGFTGRQSVVLHSATVEAMEPNELCSILGHEFTHIKCRHTRWLVLTNLKGSIHLPIISDVVGFVLLNWARKAEYTSDRGGLIACHDLRAAITALAKVAVGKELFKRLNIDAFLNQKETLNTDGIAKLSETLTDHPYLVNRIHALVAYSEDLQRPAQEPV
jgi:Zn-dependent protease with chaperone function